MQPKKTAAALLICLAALPALFAQSKLDQQAGTKKNDPAPSNSKSSVQKMNIVKVNLMAIALKNYSFQYERVINKRISVALGLRTMPSTTLPFKSAFNNIAGSDDPQVSQTINDLKIGNFAITPEVRFYLGKKGFGRGFYIAPYYRFAKFTSSELPIEYATSPTTTNTVKLKGDVATHTGGLMFGAQWALGKYISLDWWILGAHYGKSNGSLTGVPTSPLTAAEQNDIRTTIEDFNESLPVGKITSQISANSVKAIIDGPWAGVRAGLTIGFRF